MKIDRISATIRYSKDIGSGWKVVELGAEGTIDPKEEWQQAQADLYAELGSQLKSLWAGNGHREEEQTAAEPQVPEHWCPEHQQEFKRYERKTGRGLSVWYAHQLPDKSWCRERDHAS